MELFSAKMFNGFWQLNISAKKLHRSNATLSEKQCSCLL